MIRTRGAAGAAVRAAVVAACLGAGWWPAAASAHAIIEAAVPAVGATVQGPDVAVALRFNSRLDHQRSRISVKTPGGESRPVPLDLTDADPATLSARITGLAPGAYLLHWQVLAVDGHMTRGDIPFVVGPLAAGGR